jgi:predicted signal transduction protein with EAL and GGDEF domain
MLCVIAVPVVAYGVSTFVVHRPASGYNTIWDGWVYNIAQFLTVIPVLSRARRSRESRSAWLSLAAGISLITAGNLVWTFHGQNLRPIPDPAPSDAIYLVAYAAFIVGVAVLTQSSFGRVHASVRLDGAIAGLAIGAVAGMAWFEPLLHLTGRPLEIAVNMAYPLCDLVLIVLLVAGLAPHRYQPNWSTILLMTGVAWFVIGDLVTLNRIAATTYVPGTPLHETWPIGLFFIAVAASVRDRRRVNGRNAVAGSPAGITAVPVVCGILSLGVLAASLVRHDAALVQAMAIAALGLVIGRMWMTLREVRHSVENYQDARTDDLTGLPNRRAFLEHLQGEPVLR